MKKTQRYWKGKEMGRMDTIMLLKNQVLLHDLWKAVWTVWMNGQAERKLTKGSKNYGTDATLYGHNQRAESGELIRKEKYMLLVQCNAQIEKDEN